MLLMYNLLLLVLAFATHEQASAYSLSDHASITKRAVNEFLACAPNSLDPLEAQALVSGNLKEDFDLPTKWISW